MFLCIKVCGDLKIDFEKTGIPLLMITFVYCSIDDFKNRRILVYFATRAVIWFGIHVRFKSMESLYLGPIQNKDSLQKRLSPCFLFGLINSVIHQH